jgi:hypothetical protein
MVFIPAGGKASFELPSEMMKGTEPTDFVAMTIRGEPLPDWLMFDPVTGKFLGKAPEGMHGTMRIQITGKDAQGQFRVIHITVSVDVAEHGALAERAPATDGHLGRIQVAAQAAEGRAGLSEQLQASRRGMSSERLARVVSNAVMAKL